MFNNINIKSTPKTNFGGKLHFHFCSPSSMFITHLIYTKIQEKMFVVGLMSKGFFSPSQPTPLPGRNVDEFKV